jgi:hypothetical protein
MPTAPIPPVKSRVLPIEQVFRLGGFTPASVQRDYQWRTVHCLTLLNDIDRCFMASSFAPALAATPVEEPLEMETEQLDADIGDRSSSGDNSLAEGAAADASPTPLDVYMLGSIVLTPPSNGRYAIYDGLQRLTTLTILLAVLRDLTSDNDLAVRLDDLIRSTPHNGAMRIVLAGRDTTLSTQIQPRGESVKARRVATKTDMGKRIRLASQAFREKLKPWGAARRDAFTRFLMSQVHLDVQEAADARLARQIFVTTNTRGRSLDRIDLFKGQLTDIADSDLVASQIVGHWNGMRAAMGDKLDEFLVAVDFIERQAPQGSDCLNALADHIAKTRGPAKVESFVQGMTALSADYLALQDILNAAPTDALTGNIWRLQLFRWPQWRPLALLWFSDYRRALKTGGAGAARKIEAAERRFEALHKRCMGIVLAGFSTTDRETIFARAVAQAKGSANPLAHTGALAFKDVQLTRVSDSLRLPITDQEIRSVLIRWTESILHGSVPPVHVRDATVEHILPRRPAPGSDWLAEFTDVEKRYFACHTLGNLAALDKVRNEKLKNASFTEKLPVFAAARGDFKTLAVVPVLTDWSEAAIDERTQRLANLIETALDLPVATLKS